MEIDINENNKNEEVTYLYHFIPIEFLIPLIENKKLRLRRICDWSDPWENYLFKHLYVDAKKEKNSGEDASRSFYAQCWTRQKDSNAFWEIYSRDKLSIRIRTTIKKIKELPGDKPHYLSESQEVNYYSTEELDTWIRKHAKQPIHRFFQHQGKESLFKKRKEFEYEQEFRIICILDTHSKYKNEEFYDIDIPDIDDFIEEYCIDPRVDKTTEKLIRIVLSHLNIPNDKIIKSDLYTFKSQNITLKP